MPWALSVLVVLNAGVSCILNGFFNISFLGYSLLDRRDQANLPSFQEGLATWHDSFASSSLRFQYCLIKAYGGVRVRVQFPQI